MRELEFCQCNELEFCALHSTEQSVVLHRIAAHWDGVFDLFLHIVGNESFDLIKLTSSSIQTGTLMYSHHLSVKVELSPLAQNTSMLHFFIFLRKLQKYFSNLGNVHGSYT